MSRRASLPGASELFRITSSPALDLPPAVAQPPAAPTRGGSGSGNGRSGTGQGNGNGSSDGNSNGGSDGNGNSAQLSQSAAARRGSGRTKHDAKITVYVSGDELLAMEQTRLNLRARHDLILDRGRLVREAVAVLLADFDERGEESVLVQRLRAGGVDAEGDEADD
ncbi:cobyrinic acid a,c-diamide synthase [Amycolatopsis sp. H20-H5]|uniref:cobyrinic acid a,c-diamide synthase n=1 Tax=Amycolatopsis sp. H20-H5 TaxID=3046309 RepID=UPI002DBFF98A|nr:cobyrinic acid a,c-diamide synthase [Amycolatopsis sp. H20-H5]MEC3978676.1 cobyrinic acid a,c-diamide synthase [Amycolatopsis sp. H20-H5]